MFFVYFGCVLFIVSCIFIFIKTYTVITFKKNVFSPKENKANIFFESREYFISTLNENIKKKNKFIMIICHVSYKDLTITLNKIESDYIVNEIEKRIQKINDRYYPQNLDTERGKLRTEEYGFIVPHDMEKAEKAVHALLAIISEPIFVSKYEIILDCNAGITDSVNCFNAGMIMTNADMALLHAMKEGSGKYKIYTKEIGAQFRSRMELISNIRLGLNSGEFEPFFQPRVDAKTGRPLGAEALARWRHKGKLISPGIFIPIAEESELIIQLGDTILTRACHIGAKFVKEFGKNAPVISVNISRQQLTNELPDIIRSILIDSGFPAEKLELELTESNFINSSETLPILKRIKDMGIKIALDDFGTGYSALQYLDTFRTILFALKIDMSFTKRINDKECPSNNIVRNIFAIAKTSSLYTIVEGVETEEQKEFMNAQDADEIQGYLYGKPMPKDEFFDWYKKHLTPFVKH